jgi:hypothetical protein
MHISPGVVEGAKLTLSYATATGSIGFAAKLAVDAVKTDSSVFKGLASLGVRSTIAAALVFSFFEILPHQPVGVSEVHLILGSTLFLMFGAPAAAIGLTLGLLVQGLFFTPFDLPQFGMNITTLLAPLFAMSVLARRIIPGNVAYKDVSYGQALALSTAFQGGIVSWVAFWALYGQGFGVENLAQIGAFGAAYMTVIAVEPLVDLAVLAAVKGLHRFADGLVLQKRLFNATGA